MHTHEPNDDDKIKERKPLPDDRGLRECRNIDIEVIDFMFPKDYHPKPYSMTIRVPIHNYMVSKRIRDPPYIKLNKEDLKHMFHQIAQILDFDVDSLYRHKESTKYFDDAMRYWMILMQKRIVEESKKLKTLVEEEDEDG